MKAYIRNSEEKKIIGYMSYDGKEIWLKSDHSNNYALILGAMCITIHGEDNDWHGYKPIHEGDEILIQF